MQKDAAAFKHAEPRKALRSFLQNWLPLSEACLDMVAEQLPNPRQAAEEKVKALYPVGYYEAQVAQVPPELKQVQLPVPIKLFQRLSIGLPFSEASPASLQLFFLHLLPLRNPFLRP